MRRLFDMDKPLMQGLSIAADMLLLNLLTMLCCVPVFTGGAAFTAVHDVTRRLVYGEVGSSVTKSYFRSFTRNLKQGSLLGLLFLLAAVILYVDYQAAAGFFPPLRVAAAAVAVLLLALAVYAFSLLARYDNSLPATLKNALALAVGFFPRTLGILCFFLAFWVLSIRYFQMGAPILLMFGLSLPCYVSTLLLRPVFDRLEGDGNKTKEEQP